MCRRDACRGVFVLKSVALNRCWVSRHLPRLQHQSCGGLGDTLGGWTIGGSEAAGPVQVVDLLMSGSGWLSAGLRGEYERATWCRPWFH